MFTSLDAYLCRTLRELSKQSILEFNSQPLLYHVPEHAVVAL